MKRTRVLLAVAALAGVACDRGPNGPTPGVLRVQLTQPAVNSGLDVAMLFSVSGPAAPISVAPGSGLRVFPGALGTTTVLIVTGALTNGATVAAFDVPDTRAVTQYSAAIRQIATPTYAIRDTTGAGYRLRVVR